MATRSQVREVVVQLLYAYDSGNEGISKFVEEILEEHKIKKCTKKFCARIVFWRNCKFGILRLAHYTSAKGLGF